MSILPTPHLILMRDHVDQLHVVTMLAEIETKSQKELCINSF